MNSEQAADIAIKFAKTHGTPFVKLIDATQIGKIWYVKIDVGVISVDIRTIKIDDVLGRIISIS